MYLNWNAPDLENDHAQAGTYGMPVDNPEAAAETRWADVLISTREALNVERDELADRLNWERKKLWRWETGRVTTIDASDLIAVARALGIPPANMLSALDPDGDDLELPPPLPREMQQLVALYSEMGERERAELLDWVGKVNDWAEMRITQSGATPARRRRTG